MWHQIDRGSPNYFRVVHMDQMDEDDPYYDVWLTTEAGFDRIGDMAVSATVALYSGRLETIQEESEIFNWVFDGNDQPREQMFLNNIHQYQETAREQVASYAEWAEYLLADDLKRANEVVCQ